MTDREIRALNKIAEARRSPKFTFAEKLQLNWWEAVIHAAAEIDRQEAAR